MIKKIIKIFIVLTLLFSFGITIVNADNEYNGYKNLDISNQINSDADIVKSDNLNHTIIKGTTPLEKNNLFNSVKSSEHFDANITGEKGIQNIILNIAVDIKNIFLAITGIYFLIIVFRQLMSENAEEDFEKFKKGIRWITAGIILMQISFSFVETIYNKEIDGKLAGQLTTDIIQPMVNLLEYAASFMFIAIAIFAYYSLVTSNGDEEKAKKGKMSIAYAIIGFMVIQLSKYLVSGVYGEILCNSKNEINCNASEIEKSAGIIFDIIKWVNNFVGIVVVIMIIYAGVQIIFSNGEEDKIKKAKKSLLYIGIGIFILTANYFILTLFMSDKIVT